MAPMAIFSEHAGKGPAALSRARIEAALQRKAWAYSIDADGDIGGVWSGHPFYFYIAGDKDEILHVQGRWRETLGLDRRDEVRALLDEWHEDLFWPKGFTRQEDKGRVAVFAEHAIDCEAGITDDQLDQNLTLAIAMSLRLFEHLAEQLGTG
jgi:hypothetical protein